MDTSLQRARFTEDVRDVTQVLLLVHNWEIVLVLDKNQQRPTVHLLSCGDKMGWLS